MRTIEKAREMFAKQADAVRATLKDKYDIGPVSSMSEEEVDSACRDISKDMVSYQNTGGNKVTVYKTPEEFRANLGTRDPIGLTGKVVREHFGKIDKLYMAARETAKSVATADEAGEALKNLYVDIKKSLEAVGKIGESLNHVTRHEKNYPGYSYFAMTGKAPPDVDAVDTKALEITTGEIAGIVSDFGADNVFLFNTPKGLETRQVEIPGSNGTSWYMNKYRRSNIVILVPAFTIDQDTWIYHCPGLVLAMRPGATPDGFATASVLRMRAATGDVQYGHVRSPSGYICQGDAGPRVATSLRDARILPAMDAILAVVRDSHYSLSTASRYSGAMRVCGTCRQPDDGQCKCYVKCAKCGANIKRDNYHSVKGDDGEWYCPHHYIISNRTGERVPEEDAVLVPGAGMRHPDDVVECCISGIACVRGRATDAYRRYESLELGDGRWVSARFVEHVTIADLTEGHQRWLRDMWGPLDRHPVRGWGPISVHRRLADHDAEVQAGRKAYVPFQEEKAEIIYA